MLAAGESHPYGFKADGTYSSIQGLLSEALPLLTQLELTEPFCSSLSLSLSRCTVYSLGMVLFELLALEPPYFGITPFAATQNVLDGVRPVLPPTIESNPEFAGLVTLFENCTELEPEKRPSAAQVVEMLWEM